eukprot:362182-Chlamydomonas_euryale.AAC.10
MASGAHSGIPLMLVPQGGIECAGRADLAVFRLYVVMEEQVFSQARGSLGMCAGRRERPRLKSYAHAGKAAVHGQLVPHAGCMHVNKFKLAVPLCIPPPPYSHVELYPPQRGTSTHRPRMKSTPVAILCIPGQPQATQGHGSTPQRLRRRAQPCPTKRPAFGAAASGRRRCGEISSDAGAPVELSVRGDWGGGKGMVWTAAAACVAAPLAYASISSVHSPARPADRFERAASPPADLARMGGRAQKAASSRDDAAPPTRA